MGLVSSYLTISPLSREIGEAAISRDGIFSVALSLGLSPVPVRDHPARRCPDFPPHYRAATRLPLLFDRFLSKFVRYLILFSWYILYRKMIEIAYKVFYFFSIMPKGYVFNLVFA